jgi:hypothetical protein
MLTHAGSGLATVSLLIVYGNRFKIFGFEDVSAVETFHIIHAVSTCYELGAVVIASGRHKTP